MTKEQIKEALTEELARINGYTTPFKEGALWGMLAIAKICLRDAYSNSIKLELVLGITEVCRELEETTRNFH